MLKFFTPDITDLPWILQTHLWFLQTFTFRFIELPLLNHCKLFAASSIFQQLLLQIMLLDE